MTIANHSSTFAYSTQVPQNASYEPATGDVRRHDMTRPRGGNEISDSSDKIDLTLPSYERTMAADAYRLQPLASYPPGSLNFRQAADDDFFWVSETWVGRDVDHQTFQGFERFPSNLSDIPEMLTVVPATAAAA